MGPQSSSNHRFCLGSPIKSLNSISTFPKNKKMMIKIEFLLFAALAVSLFAGTIDGTCRTVKMPYDGTCAILFDNDDCDGRQHYVNEGYTKLSYSADTVKRNTAESVLVRDGCVFVGYDHIYDEGKGFGENIAVAASEGHKYQDLDEEGFKDLDEDISAVFCTCNGFPHSGK